MSKRDEVKRIDIKEFKEKGYLQEVNRQFLHPLGLALEVIIDEESGDCSLGGVWDYRNDPEGIVFGELSSKGNAEKAKAISEERKRKAKSRQEILGYVIQPIIK